MPAELGSGADPLLSCTGLPDLVGVGMELGVEN